jgi:formylmethanofuran dehydrogenase subunit E
MPPAVAAQEIVQDSKPVRPACSQCGERVEQRDRRAPLRERPLCEDCATDNFPFTD